MTKKPTKQAAPPILLREDQRVTASIPSLSDALAGERLRGVIENYLSYYASGEGHTARAKRYDLQYFLEHIAQSPERINYVLVGEWTLQQTQSFVDHRLALGEAPSTVGRRLATVKHFGRTLAERVHGFINPAREARGPVQAVSRPHGLDADEIEALHWAAQPESSGKSDPFVAKRNQFLVEILLATGLRADEVRLLLIGQISEDLHWLKNVKTKGRKFRNVYMANDLQNTTREYLIAREQELLSRFPAYEALSPVQRSAFPVFVSFYQAQLSAPDSFGLSPKTVWRIIAQTGKRAQKNYVDLLGNLHPHRLRHTFAHGLLDSSKDIRLVAQALGHSDVRTTMRYTERTEEEIARAIEKKNSDNS